MLGVGVYCPWPGIADLLVVVMLESVMCASRMMHHVVATLDETRVVYIYIFIKLGYPHSSKNPNVSIAARKLLVTIGTVSQAVDNY